MKSRLEQHLSEAFFGERPWRTLARLAALLIGVFLLTRYVLTPTVVDGTCMTPTFEEGELLLINRIAFRSRPVNRGDVVFIRDGRVLLLKRIVALPGETVAITNGTVLINRAPLLEPYAGITRSWNYLSEKLGPDEYLVMGDNRAIEQVFGKARRELIVGRPAFY